MPFTPFHMGPGILIKSVLNGSFSLMVFGWAQIVMDLQPLFALITGEGELHGFSHTYLGATILAIFSALSGKYLAQLGLYMLGVTSSYKNNIPWIIVIFSAFVGSYSHVFIDSIMHSDMRPLYPFSNVNSWLGYIDVSVLHDICLYTGLIGAGIYFVVQWKNEKYV